MHRSLAIPIFFIVPGILVFLLGANEYFDSLELARSGELVEGEVVGARTTSDDVFATVRYRFDGDSHEVETTSGDGVFQTGEPLQVLVDPSRPDKAARVVCFSELYMDTCLSMIIGLLMFLGGVAFLPRENLLRRFLGGVWRLVGWAIHRSTGGGIVAPGQLGADGLSLGLGLQASASVSRLRHLSSITTPERASVTSLFGETESAFLAFLGLAAEWSEEHMTLWSRTLMVGLLAGLLGGGVVGMVFSLPLDLGQILYRGVLPVLLGVGGLVGLVRLYRGTRRPEQGERAQQRGLLVFEILGRVEPFADERQESSFFGDALGTLQETWALEVPLRGGERLWFMYKCEVEESRLHMLLRTRSGAASWDGLGVGANTVAVEAATHSVEGDTVSLDWRATWVAIPDADAIDEVARLVALGLLRAQVPASQGVVDVAGEAGIEVDASPAGGVGEVQQSASATLTPLLPPRPRSTGGREARLQVGAETAKHVGVGVFIAAVWISTSFVAWVPAIALEVWPMHLFGGLAIGACMVLWRPQLHVRKKALTVDAPVEAPRLRLDGASLVATHTGETISLDQTFSVQLTRHPFLSTEITALLGLEIRQASADGKTRRSISVSFLAGRGDAADELTVYALSAPVVSEEDVLDWLWPTLTYFAEAGGSPLRTSLRPRETTSTEKRTH